MPGPLRADIAFTVHPDGQCIMEAGTDLVDHSPDQQTWKVRGASGGRAGRPERADHVLPLARIAYGLAVVATESVSHDRANTRVNPRIRSTLA